jgi:parallel beta-helix repeat protein
MLTIIKKNDTYDVIEYQLENEDGTIADLTGASVNFVMGKKNKLITNSSANITSAINGIVQYQLTEIDTLVSGTFLGEFVVTFSNGKVKTYPSNGYITVDIEQNLDTTQNNIVLDMIAEKQGEFTDKLNSILQQAGNVNMSYVNEYNWMSTDGQVTYVFPSTANYTAASAKWFQVFVGNVFVDNSLVNRIHDDQFTLSIDPSRITDGVTVTARWIEPIAPIVPSSYKIIPQQPLPPVDAEEGDLWFDTSDDTYQGTVFDGLNTRVANAETSLADNASPSIKLESFKIQVPEVDDAPRIVRALTSLGVNGGRLEFKTFATYTVNTFIELPSNVEIIGNQATIKNTVSGMSFLFKAEGKTNVTIKSLNFVPDATNKPNCGLRVKDSTNAIIEDCSANGFNLSGFIISGTNGLEMKRCTANNNITQRGFDIQASRTTLTKCTAEGNKTDGFYIWSSKTFVATDVTLKECNGNNNQNFGFNTFGELDTVAGSDFGRLWGVQALRLENCTATGNGTNGQYSGIQFDGVNVGWIKNCYANNNNEHGICLMDSRFINVSDNYANGNNMSGIRLQGEYLKKSSYDGNWRGVWYSRIENNTCDGNGINSFSIVSSYIDGIALDYNCQYNVIKDNTLKANLGYGVDIKHVAGYADCLNNILEENFYISNTTGDYFIDAYNVKYNRVIPYRKQKQATVDASGNLVLGVGDFFFCATTATQVINVHTDEGYTGFGYPRVVFIRFTGAVTLVDGGNLKLNGNLTAGNNTTLALMSDGLNWYELSRSVNA